MILTTAVKVGVQAVALSPYNLISLALLFSVSNNNSNNAAATNLVTTW